VVIVPVIGIVENTLLDLATQLDGQAPNGYSGHSPSKKLAN
jgi:hypothetical protein